MSTKPTYEELEQRVQELEQAVSEGKKTEELMWWQKQFFPLLVNFSSDILVFIDKNGEQKFISPSAEKITGYTVGELQRPFAEIIHPEDLPRVERGFEKLLNNPETVVTVNYRHKHKDGGYRYFETVGRNFLDNPLVQGIVANVRDITERRSMEEAFRKSEAQKKAILDGITTNLAFVNENLEILWANKTASDSVNRTVDDIIGLKCHELWADPDSPCDDCPTAKAFKTKKTEQTIIHTPDGRIWEEKGEPVFDGKGQLLGVLEIAHDITARARAEEGLRESEAKYRRLAENSPAVVYQFMMTSEGAYSFPYVSRSMLDMTGIPAEAVMQDAGLFLDKMHSEDQDWFYESVIKSAETLDPWHGIFRFSLKGKERWIEGHSTPEPLPDGRILWDGFLFDVTDRKHAEEALRESERFLRTIVENIPDMIFVKNAKDLRFVRFNKAGEELLGYAREELLGKNDYDFFPKEEANFFTEKDRDVLSSGKHLDIPEELIQTKDKGKRILHTKKIPIINEEGMPQYLLGISEDITERKQAEEAFIESEQRYRRLAENSPDMIYRMSLPDGKYEYVSPAVTSISGYPPEVWYNNSFDTREIIHPDFHSYFEAQWENLLKGHLPPTYEYKIIHKDESIRWLNQRNILVKDEDGHPTAIEGIVTDITERKRAEEEKESLQSQLQQSQKMEAIGTLAGGIAHDFNNILAVILGNTELAAFDIPDSNPAAKSLKAIHQASIRAKDMVQQLLAFSRKSDEKSRPFNVTPIIKESIEMLRSAVPTSVEFKQHLSGDLCNVLGDATQIHQIVMNLVTNAAHAMSEEGGLLELTLENITLQEEKSCFDWVLSPGEYIRLKVRDTGEGIEPTIIDRIFEPYYTTKEVGKGTGMGLSVVHGIVKRHGGGIRVESELGKGTIFEIYLPALEKAAGEEKEPEGEIKGGFERILFVDDEESLVTLNHQRLERLGYNVKSTTNSVEALEWFRADPDQFDVIITDMTMPRMTGDRLAVEVLKIRPHLSVIICTGYSERMSEGKAKNIGVSKYVEKPIDLRNLASSIREVLDGK